MGPKPGVRVLVCLVSIYLITVHGQSDSEDSRCKNKMTCAACIRTPQCVWCSEIDKKEARCMQREKSGSSCSKDRVVDKKENTTSFPENKPFSSEHEHQNQMKPQKIKMTLRRQEEQRVIISYQQAEDYPVDLYFLMDLSASMEPYRNELAELGERLAQAMTNLTSNFQLGFGSFIDKVVLPMTNTQTSWLAQCKLNDGTRCALPYEFRHQMQLGKNVSLFKEKVRNAEISANLDVPEGGLDALMQAMVCGERIGWRTNARRLLVYSADAKYHIAGDGRLAGIVEPNDETCHLDEKGFYTHGEILDYPSITQINKHVQKNSINVVFDVTKDVTDYYNDLSKRINGSSVGILDNKSQSVVDIIRSHYKSLTNTIKMTSTHPEFVQVKFFSSCMNQFGEPREMNECGDIRVNKPVQFEVAIKVIECPERPEEWKNRVIEIKPEGVNERVRIEFDLMCDCPCSKSNHEDFKANAGECNGNGNLACGICECSTSFSGEYCNCTRNAMDTNEASTAGCLPPRRNGTKVQSCSGKDRGACICGKCECNPGYTGDFCECDDSSCPRARSNNKVCGGRSQGECNCGNCECMPDWEGTYCECSKRKDNCINPKDNPNNDEECSGFGKCKCGKCECEAGRYGKYCQNCTKCSNQRCEMLKDCVECHVHKSGPAAVGDECGPAACTYVTVAEKVDTIDMPEEDSNYKKCVVPDNSGCTFAFKYEVGDKRRGDQALDTVIAEKEKKCSALPMFSPLTTAGGVIFLTLLLGLLGLLAWKAVTMFHDNREYAKFEKERVRAIYGREINPLYKDPTTTVNNPMCGVKD